MANTDPDASDDALYLECLASEVPSDRLEDALEVYVNGPHRQQGRIAHRLEDYGDDQPLGLYVAIPQQAYLPVVTRDAEGRQLDGRKEIDLASLRW